MDEKASLALRKVFAEAVKLQIGDDRNHGWSANDSLEVIEAVIGEDATVEIPNLIKNGKKPESYTVSDTAKALIKKVINPSAFRQELEGQLRPDKQTMLAKSEKSKREKAAIDYYTTA